MEQDEVTAFLTDLFKKSELRVLLPVDSFCNKKEIALKSKLKCLDTVNSI